MHLCVTLHVLPTSGAAVESSDFIINPLPGQYANSTFIAYAPDETILFSQWYNTSFQEYVEPGVINATRTFAEISYPWTWGDWLTINLTDRWVLDGTAGWENTWYWDWIETNITIGSTVNVYTEIAEVVGMETVEINVNGEDRLLDCWVVNWTLYDTDHFVEFYDVQTGLLVYQIEELLWIPGVYYYVYYTLVSTNIPVGEPPCVSAGVDVVPNTLNLRSSGGWITAYIELPEGYNVSDIDRTAIVLNGTIPVDPFWVDKPLESVIGDYDNDTVPDLMVKFNRTEVSEYILNQNITYGNVTLTLTGQLTDGTLFEGSDVIRVRMPGDVDCNGKVDIMDIVLVAVRYGESDPEPYYDMNEDGKIDILDIVLIAGNYGKTY